VALDSEEDRAAHEAQRQEQERAFADLLTWLKETLSDHVKEVRLSHAPDHIARLPDNRHLRHHTCARAHVPGFRTTVPVGKRSLELNPKYSLVTGLQHAHKAGGDDAQMCRLVEAAELLYGTAFLADGGIPEDPAKFAGSLADRLARTVYDATRARPPAKRRSTIRSLR
jgi:molecular chaperone HtpG